MKNIFEVSREEKERILNLHENATKNQYLKEDEEGIEPWMQGNNPSGNPKNKLDLSSLKDLNNQDNKPGPNPIVQFMFPFPTEFHEPGGIDAIYDRSHNRVMINWNNQFFALVDKTKLEEDPHNLSDFTWVKELNGQYNNFNDNYFTPSYDNNNKGLVWVEISIDRKNKAKVVNEYPVNRKLPQ